MIKIIKLNLFCLFSILLLLSSKWAVAIVVDTPVIKAGTAKLTGRIISVTETNKDNITVNVTISQPISGEYVQYKAPVDQLGKFALDVDLETTIALISLNITLDSEKFLLVKLTNDGVTNVDITYNAENDIQNISVTPNIAQDDMLRGFEFMNKMISYKSGRTPEALYNKSTAYYLNYSKVILSERLEILNHNSSVSKELKGVLSKDFHLFLYGLHVFDYQQEMMRNYRNTTSNEGTSTDIQKIDRSYFRFLKDFELSDPQYLLAFTFHEFQKKILQNEILALPVIGENDISSWLVSVKTILSDLVGFVDGQYYDILAANAYARQLNEEVKPLSGKQQANIIKYWGNGEIAKILFRKNQQVVELAKVKSVAVVNEISSTADDKVMETILSKYENKVVLVDLWATWCAPCLEAMQLFRSAKSEYKNKEVVFVYLSNSSSPRKLWEEKIKGIGDEHYYLTDSQWEYIMKHFGFEAIPSYLLFNKEGMLKNKFTAFPENEKVKEMINELL